MNMCDPLKWKENKEIQLEGTEFILNLQHDIVYKAQQLLR